MTERLHTPPRYDEIADDTSLIFLAGPIKGSPDWQTDTALELLYHSPEAEVASPRRFSKNEADFNYDEQVEWEIAHLRRSHTLGVVAFWFGAQDHSLPYDKARPYAKTSWTELSRMVGWNDFRPFPLVVGIDPEYTPNGGQNERYIRAMCRLSNVAIYDALEDVVDQSILRLPIARPTHALIFRSAQPD